MATKDRLTIFSFSIMMTAMLVGGILFPASFSLAQDVQLIHFPVKTGFESQNIQLEAKIDNMRIQVYYVRIYYRVKGSENYQYVEMDEETDSFVGEIPGSDVRSPAMEYFLMAVLKDQTMITTPASNPYYSPYEISITPKASQRTDKPPASAKQKISSAAGTAITTLILSPEPNENILDKDVIIAVSFLVEQGGIDPRSIQLILDGKNVTSSAEVTSLMVSYVPGNLNPGRHVVKLSVKDQTGVALEPLEWSFYVVRQEKASTIKKRPFSGRIFADYKNESVSDSTLSTFNSGVDFNGKWGGIHYKGLAFVTSREEKDQQPRNRFLLDVGTSWIGVRLGDTNPRFNDLILWGKRVRGIEAYLKLGFINIEFVQGETNRAIAGKPYDILTNTNGDTIKDAYGKPIWFHPVTGATVQSTDGVYQYGTFKQTLTAIRPSIGGGKYFQLGLNLLKVKDDVKSIKYGIAPKDNLVFGPDFLLAFDNHRIEFKAGAAFSLLTNDISSGPLTKAGIDTTFDTEIPFDPAEFEDVLILNASTTPLNPTKLTSLAYNAQFRFSYFNNSIIVQYKSIGSEFNSLGNTYLRKNIQGYSISDRIRLFQNQVYVTLGYEQYIDGLDKKNDDIPSTEPTLLTTYNVGISYYPRSVVMPKVSVNYKNHNRDNDLATQQQAANAIANQTQDISVQLGYDVRLFDLDHGLSLSIIGTDRADDINPNNTNMATDIRMVTLKTKYQMPLTTTITFATNQNQTGKGVSNAYSFEYNLIGINADYFFFNQRLKINGGLNLTSASGSKPEAIINPNTGQSTFVSGEYTNYKRTAFEVGGSYQITSKQSILFNAVFINFDDKKNSISQDDTIMRLRYELKY